MMVVFVHKNTHTSSLIKQKEKKRNFSSVHFDVVLLQMCEKIGKRFLDELYIEDALKTGYFTCWNIQAC